MIEHVLERLTAWYEAQCNDDWEHQYGISIDTLDNPGWNVSIDLRGTVLFAREFHEVSIERSERDWIRCTLEDGRFQAFGGPGNLAEILRTFLDWAEPNGQVAT